MYLRAPFKLIRNLKQYSSCLSCIQPANSQLNARSTTNTSFSKNISNTNGASDCISSPSIQNGTSNFVWRRNYSSDTQKCWKCGFDLRKSSVFCKKCEVIQQPDTKISYFNILGVEQKYEVELSDLTSNYRRLQNVLHPDRFTNRHDEEKRLSEEYSSLLNKAYFTLVNPLKRGLYLLELSGVFVEEGKTQSSPDFLMEIMERNEDVDDAKSAAQLEKLNKQNKASIEKLIGELTNAFKTENLKLAEETVIKMKYYASIDLKIKELKQKDL